MNDLYIEIELKDKGEQYTLEHASFIFHFFSISIIKDQMFIVVEFFIRNFSLNGFFQW